MNDKQFHFWQKWLTYANVMTVVVGLIVALAGNSIFLQLHNDYSQRVFFNSSDFPADVLPFKNWLFGIIGATIVGFHLLMIMISEHPFKQKEKWAYQAMWLGMISWFIIDSGISLYYGAVHNVVLINLVALTLIGIPLVMTRKVFS